MTTNETKPIHTFETTVYHENLETGQKDVPGKRVTIRGTGEAIYDFWKRNRKIIRKGKALDKRLQQIAKQKAKATIKELGQSKYVDELVSDSRRG